MRSLSITICKTRDPAALESIFRLRYAGLIAEMGLTCSETAHEERRLCDDADTTGHLFAATTTSGDLVGTARANLLRESVPPPFDSLLSAIGPEAPPTETLSVTSRLIVTADYRKSTLAARLAVAVYEHGLAHGIDHDLIFSQPAHVALYTRMGYRSLSTPAISHPQGLLIPLLLTVRDWDYLTQMGSIFRRAPSFGI
jgi:predicted GNAT family N-acyltransferase